jgi:hypothetical protein
MKGANYVEKIGKVFRLVLVMLFVSHVVYAYTQTTDDDPPDCGDDTTYLQSSANVNPQH